MCAETVNNTPLLGTFHVYWGKVKIDAYVFWEVFTADLCLAISKESSRRDLLNDMPEHPPIFKNNQNTLYPRFIFTPKTGQNSLELKIRFCCIVVF